MLTALGYDDIFLQHRTGRHPERPERLVSIVETLKKDGIWDELVPITARVEPKKWISMVHEQKYIKRIADACRNKLPFIDT